MKVLVIGGTGYIGGHTVEELVRRGHEVSVFARGRKRPPLPEGVAFVEGDRHNPEDVARARSLRFDAIIDINAYTREESQALIQSFDGLLSRFVHLSTISVCQMTSELPFDESDPLVTDPNNSYGYNKAECERALRWAHAKSGFPFVSVRPPAVIGPRDDKSRENYYLKRLVAGDPIIVPDSGAIPVFAIFVKDLAAVLADALTAEAAVGSAYHVAQSGLISVNNHIANIARLAGLEADVAHVPRALLERLGFNLQHFPYATGDRLIVLDTSAAERDLGFTPTPYAAALRETVEHFLERGPEGQKSIEDHFPPLMPRSRERALVDRYRAEVCALEDRLTDEWLNEAMPEM
ncbi:MAG TPA: NAD-dependent epimerase/dehydratase family protein [Blastocatellia bacterium]|jgi:nucleoside-diphosphate-sugar epimerase|nr:NAD-dependent epimerase/dehydratase family protein [Blastocatellia bacterium]